MRRYRPRDVVKATKSERGSWWSGWGPLVALFVIAVLLRVAVGGIWNIRVDHRGDALLRGYSFYVRIARNVLAGEGPHWNLYNDLGDRLAGRPPLFSYLVAGLMGVFASPIWPVIIVQSLLGGARTVFVALCGREIGGTRMGLIAGALAALYPYWVGNDATMLENTLFGALVAGGIWLTLRVRLERGGVRTVIAAGVLLGLAALTREMIGLLLPVIALMLLFRPREVAWKRRFVLVTLLTASVVVVTAPWIVRTAQLTGRASLSTSAGRALWLGNNEYTFAKYPAGSIDASEVVAWSHLSEEAKQRLWDLKDDEVAQDALFGEMAKTWIRANPGEFVKRGFRKVGALLSPVSGGTWERRSLVRTLGYTGGYGGLLVLALAGFVVGWRRLGSWRVLTLGAFGSIAVMAFIYWGQGRLRAAYDIFLIVPAALVLELLWLRFRGPAGSGAKETPVA